jgi:glutathione S-transferase
MSGGWRSRSGRWITFSHEPLSVFSTFDDFAAINPVMKAPTLVTAEGTILMDSSLILDYAGRLASPERSLLPDDIFAHARG